MKTRRKFTFRLSILVQAAGRLQSALTDPDYQAPMAERLGDGFAADFALKITAVTGKGNEQSSQTGDIALLTGAQLAFFQEMERLTNGARRSAKLAFPGQNVVLGQEFQVGVDTPKTLSAEIERAGKTHAATLKYATELKAKGWLAKDASELGTAIAGLSGKDVEQEEALDDRLGLTDEKVIAANALYEACLTIQNAARLQYPEKKDLQGNAQNVTERARFLVDEFPPRDRSEPDGGTQSGATPTPPAV